jgi:hypothetical protein
MELSIVVTRGSTYLVPPPSELSQMILSDAETVEAYGPVEPLPGYPAEHWWPIIEQWGRTIYQAASGETRAAMYKRCLRDYRKSQRGQQQMALPLGG